MISLAFWVIIALVLIVYIVWSAAMWANDNNEFLEESFFLFIVTLPGFIIFMIILAIIIFILLIPELHRERKEKREFYDILKKIDHKS